MIRVVVADDQALVRAGLRMILDEEPDITVVGEADDGSAAVALVAETRPDVVLMDVRMPGVDGIAATRELVRSGATARVLMLTTFDLDEHVYDAVVAGASGFLLKDVPPGQLVAGVRSVAAGDALLAPSITRRLLARFVQRRPLGADEVPAPLVGLTEREREILTHIARGRSNDEVAAALHLSPATVKTHVGRVLAKLGLRDRVQAVVLAYETGWVQPGAPDV